MTQQPHFSIPVFKSLTEELISWVASSPSSQKTN